MIGYLLKKAGYGLLVLAGVVTVVFFLFNLAPGDPVRNMVGENASEEVVENMRRKFDLDVPVFKRFCLYINDLSPVSIHDDSQANSRIFYDQTEYNGLRISGLWETRALYVKWPYLKRSFVSDKSVSSILGEVLPGTFVLALVSIIMAMFLGLIMGVLAALEKDTVLDRLLLFISALGMAGPSFFVAILVAWVGAVLWRDSVFIPVVLIVISAFSILLMLLPEKYFRSVGRNRRRVGTMAFACGMFIWIIAAILTDFPWVSMSIQLPGTGLNMTGSLYSVDVWKGEYLDFRNMILPVITLMVRPLSVIVQLTRSSLLEVMNQDFIRTARAKGLSEFTVVTKHALRNALNPVVTAVSGWFASLLAGAIFVEFVFGWKGMGQQMFNAIENQDLPVVMGGVIVIASAFVVINVLVDFVYGWIDPRVRI